MELFWAACSTLVQIALLSVFLYGPAKVFLPTTFAIELSRPACIGIASLLVMLYNTYIYPRYLDPLRTVPMVKVEDPRVLLPVTDAPRGEEAFEWAKQYSEEAVIRVNGLGPRYSLMPLSPAALRDVLSTHQQDFVKPTTGRTFLSRILGYGLVVAEGQTHARQRKALNTSFRIQNIRALHGLISTKADLMIEKMSEEVTATGKCEVSEWASRATLDIIGPSLMSHEFDSLRIAKQPINEAFSRLLTPDPGQTFLFTSGLFLPKFLVVRLPTKANAIIETNVKIVRQFCEGKLKKLYHEGHGVQAAPKSDILASIVNDPLTNRTEIVDQMLTFLGAGHETTSTAIAWATHLLTLPENAHYQRKLYDEVRQNVGCTESPTALENLPWLHGILEETLRLFPSVTTTARRAVRDTTVAGHHVPKNTLIGIYPWIVNRNPRYWGGEKADQFVPERWIDTLPDGRLRPNKHGGAESNYCDLTFLHGNRSCIGKEFAKAELRCILAKWYGSYKVSRLEGDDLRARPVGSITVKPAGGLHVTMQKIQA